MKLIKVGKLFGEITAETEKERDILANHLGVEWCKQWLTSYGKAYNFIAFYELLDNTKPKY